MDEEVLEIAKDYDLTADEAEEVKDLADEEGLDTDEAYQLWEEL